ncbi:YtxH domain-containing protein [Pontibacter arcticus]|uniref:YtxH domain-containing protein n=1 Tax=Pontibacter arcticus TaxID=2080288 RepID=A0A364RDC1_9BACT|nr:YtxH domain-containing protein [Pontibacter arcticus]RAU82257.1 YtxH domain-containing protein [Pontibacter arcticus]
MKDNSGKVLLAMLAGASAGVIAGLLMAPDSGEATRTSVKKWAGKLSKDLEKNLQTSLEDIKKMSTDAYSKVANAAGAGTEGGNTTATDSAANKNQSGGTTGGGNAGGSTFTSGGNA